MNKTRPFPDDLGLGSPVIQKKKAADSTIASPPPPKPAVFSNERFTAARHETKDAINKMFPYIFFLFCKWLSNDDVGVSVDTVLQEIRSEAGFKTGGGFVSEKSGGLP